MGASNRIPMVAVMLIFILAGSAGLAQNFTDIKPSPQQVAWQDLEFGVLIHFGTNTFLDREWGDGTASPKVCAPSQIDPEQWMRAIKAAGAKYVVLVAKHRDGFCVWPTRQIDYSVKGSAWENGQDDVVRRVSHATRKFDLKFGVYLSPWDRHEPSYQNSAKYDDYYIAELSELTANYGDLVEFWLDGAAVKATSTIFLALSIIFASPSRTRWYSPTPLYLNMETSAGLGMRMELSLTKTGTCSTGTDIFAGGRWKQTPRFTRTTGSGTPTMKPHSSQWRSWCQAMKKPSAEAAS